MKCVRRDCLPQVCAAFKSVAWSVDNEVLYYFKHMKKTFLLKKTIVKIGCTLKL